MIKDLVPLLLLCITLESLAASSSVNCGDINTVNEVQSGVFVRPGNNGIIFKDKNVANIGFIVGEKAIAVIDSGGSIKEAEQLKCQIKKVSHLPIRYLINTHVHPDHTMGNSVFNDPEIEFIGHQNLTRAIGVLSKTYLRRYNQTSEEKLSDESIILPDTKVLDELKIDLGNRIITLTAVQKAHTDNDLIVYDEKTDTLWLSDLLFHQHIPVIGKSGSVNGWLNFLRTLKNRRIKNIIPGHGPLKLDIDEARNDQARYLTLLRDEVRNNLSSDEDLNLAIENIGLSESPKWKMFPQYHKRNISYIFSDLEWE